VRRRSRARGASGDYTASPALRSPCSSAHPSKCHASRALAASAPPSGSAPMRCARVGTMLASVLAGGNRPSGERQSVAFPAHERQNVDFPARERQNVGFPARERKNVDFMVPFRGRSAANRLTERGHSAEQSEIYLRPCRLADHSSADRTQCMRRASPRHGSRSVNQRRTVLPASRRCTICSRA
jgi:hypothetical protein